MSNFKFWHSEKSKFSESQIIRMIGQYEKDVKVADICREHGIGQGPFYNWKGRYVGMDESQPKRLISGTFLNLDKIFESRLATKKPRQLHVRVL